MKRRDVLVGLGTVSTLALGKFVSDPALADRRDEKHEDITEWMRQNPNVAQKLFDEFNAWRTSFLGRFVRQRAKDDLKIEDCTFHFIVRMFRPPQIERGVTLKTSPLRTALFQITYPTKAGGTDTSQYPIARFATDEMKGLIQETSTQWDDNFARILTDEQKKYLEAIINR